MPTAGYVGTIQQSPDGSAWQDVDGINSVSFSKSREMLDKTYLNQSDAAKKRFAGIKDGTISLDGDSLWGDTNGQVILRAAQEAGTDIWLLFRPSGVVSEGWKVMGLIESFQISGGVDGKNTVSFSFVFTGAVTEE